MTLQPFKVNTFGGLNLRDDPAEIGAGGAIDLLNVVFDRNGLVRCRDGYSAVYTGPSASVTNMYSALGGNVLAAFNADSVKVINTNTGTATATTALGAASSSFAGVGASGAIYFSNRLLGQIRKWDGAAFSSPAGLAAIQGTYLATQPLDDRLVVADATDVSLLRFSGAGAPETMGATDIVRLTPGDGEQIAGLAAFGTDLYAFKQSKFFIFYGNSTDATGAAVFNYRMVDTGIGCLGLQQNVANLVVTHPTGVYFVAKDGVYRTVGGPPERVSDAISPVFAGANMAIPSPFSTTLSATVSSWGNLSATHDHLYLRTGFIPGKTFVMSFADRKWTFLDWDVYTVVAGADLNAGGNLLDQAVITGGDTGIVGKSTPTITTDNGGSLNWRYQSGWYDVSGQDFESRTRYSKVRGTGTPNLTLLNDYRTTGWSGVQSVTLGTAPTSAEGHAACQGQGVLYSHKLTGAATATVDSLTHWVASVRTTGLRH